MTPVSGHHLSPDDFDAWLAGALAPAAQEHLAGCLACRERAETEREIVALVEALPLMSPTPGFADRVMARVTVPSRCTSGRSTCSAAGCSPPSARWPLPPASLSLVAGSMAGSIVWTLGHQETLAALGGWLSAQAGQAAWLGVRGIASNFIEQPWFAGLKALAGSPGRLAIASAVTLLAYLSGVLALRRLLALPTQRVAHVGA